MIISFICLNRYAFPQECNSGAGIHCEVSKWPPRKAVLPTAQEGACLSGKSKIRNTWPKSYVDYPPSFRVEVFHQHHYWTDTERQAHYWGVSWRAVNQQVCKHLSVATATAVTKKLTRAFSHRHKQEESLHSQTLAQGHQHKKQPCSQNWGRRKKKTVEPRPLDTNNQPHSQTRRRLCKEIRNSCSQEVTARIHLVIWLWSSVTRPLYYRKHRKYYSMCKQFTRQLPQKRVHFWKLLSEVSELCVLHVSWVNGWNVNVGVYLVHPIPAG